jgi:bifunctional DNA-binding transcriptional regulator/antitoxin component of YhaV-PrlF toxin-antitoxin module
MTKVIESDPKGSIELPQEAWDSLRITPGSKLRLKIMDDGRIMLEPYHSIWELRRSVDPQGIRLTVEEMDEVIRKEASKRAMS